MLSSTLSGWRRLLGLGREPASAGEERRVWVRFPSSAETTLSSTRAAEQGKLSGRVEDISLGGIRLVVAEPFHLGDLLSVEVPAGEQGGSSTILACVVHCRPHGDQWSLGCSFLSPLSDDDLELFGASHARASAPNQRAWARFPCQAHASYQAVRTADPFRPAEVLNLSANGVALKVPVPLPAGELLNLELRQGETLVVTTLASVVRVNVEPDGSCVIGCNFIGELGDKDLSALV